MKIRIDLKIFMFLAIFLITKQIKIYLCIMFFCFIHEIGHMLMGIIMGLKPEKLEIMPFGLNISFKTNIKKSNIEIKKIIVALAGPITSLVLAIVFTYCSPLYWTKDEIIYSNILILIFNLMPIYPLDGGRILKGILHIKFGKKDSNYISNKISNITMIGITILSSIMIYYYKNIAIFLICIFLWSITIKENKKYRTNMRIYDIIAKDER